MATENHKKYLKLALELADIRRGFCSPNPAVGAVIVDQQGHVVGKGYHREAGHPHAEIEALKNLKLANTAHLTLYVTLEPCCHHGRTPPCTEAILQSGIKKVFFAYLDPNPRVAGKGRDFLRSKGLICEQITLPSVNDFYKSYHHWTTSQRPFITCKIAMSLNGKIAGAEGRPLQLTGHELEKFTHESRKKSDALLTTAKTIKNDNPRFNVRCDDEILAKPIYVIDRNLITSSDACIFTTGKSVTLFHSPAVSPLQIERLQHKNVNLVPIAEIAQGLNLQEIIDFMGRVGVHDLWVETGATCLSALLQAKLVNRLLIYQAPLWINQGINAFNQNFNFLADLLITWKPYGRDVLCEINF